MTDGALHPDERQPKQHYEGGATRKHHYPRSMYVAADDDARPMMVG